MTNIEKLNSIMRLGIYLGIALFLFTNQSEYLLIVLVALFTFFIYKYQQDKIELFFNSIDNSNFNKIQKSLMVNDSEVKLF